ncbi:MAG: rhodanese-like domain-containing protein [Spirosomataceae bacterium]
MDIRTAEEFTNTVKGQTFRNRGHIKNAVHIPQAELEARMNELEKYKKREIVVYGFSGGPEAFASAQLLVDHGFKKVKVLSSGLSDLRWRAANVKGLKAMMQWWQTFRSKINSWKNENEVLTAMNRKTPFVTYRLDIS